MLAVFDQFVAKSPEGLSSQSSVSKSSALKDGPLIQDLYSSLHLNSVTINLGLPGFIAYSSHKQSPLLPWEGGGWVGVQIAFNLKVPNQGNLTVEHTLCGHENPTSFLSIVLATL
ncbi:hypothetical protein LOK49_LG05G02688 [Camellia lanceoleosa]|uniref:Uncharacterized protein n=1 Tax=Camellia lanceoleosa TaxID=1840588 RepID=A0ACC0HS47_9ERIC|nr:hypothetical protein LOK49_LG05G02688 [Camellia lanceoleosa]